MKQTIKIYISICLVLLLIDISLSQDTNTVKFFPLKVGNVWVYQNVNGGQWCNLITKRRIKVINSIVLNSHKYFLFSDTTRVVSGYGEICFSCGSIVFDTLRIDSINGNIYKYSYQGCNYSINERTQDSIKALWHDTIKLNCGSDLYYTCFDTNSRSLFGTVVQTREFSHWCFENGCYRRTFAKNIGEVDYSCSGMQGGSHADLLGCIINGVLYGDTTFITGIERISSEIPSSFNLYQNYPNPFNPTTKIKFAILNGVVGQTFLSVYDILGREVATLVNEKLSPGTYEVEWNAADYPSGVYFYKLQTEDYSETKKLVLLK
jgi:hypothetical protein